MDCNQFSYGKADYRKLNSHNWDKLKEIIVGTAKKSSVFLLGKKTKIKFASIEKQDLAKKHFPSGISTK